MARPAQNILSDLTKMGYVQSCRTVLSITFHDDQISHKSDGVGARVDGLTVRNNKMKYIYIS
jgi:hypothetical protein